MEFAWGLVDGRMLNAATVDAGQCAPLQIVCPECSEPLFKKQRRNVNRSFGYTHFFSHYVGTLDECSLRTTGEANEWARASRRLQQSLSEFDAEFELRLIHGARACLAPAIEAADELIEDGVHYSRTETLYPEARAVHGWAQRILQPSRGSDAFAQDATVQRWWKATEQVRAHLACKYGEGNRRILAAFALICAFAEPHSGGVRSCLRGAKGIPPSEQHIRMHIAALHLLMRYLTPRTSVEKIESVLRRLRAGPPQPIEPMAIPATRSMRKSGAGEGSTQPWRQTDRLNERLGVQTEGARLLAQSGPGEGSTRPWREANRPNERLGVQIEARPVAHSVTVRRGSRVYSLEYDVAWCTGCGERYEPNVAPLACQKCGAVIVRAVSPAVACPRSEVPRATPPQVGGSCAVTSEPRSEVPRAAPTEISDTVVNTPEAHTDPSTLTSDMTREFPTEGIPAWLKPGGLNGHCPRCKKLIWYHMGADTRWLCYLCGYRF